MGSWSTEVDREIALIELAVRIARSEHRMGKRSAESLAELEARADRDRKALTALSRGSRRRGN